jgi:hypothetical protein
VKKTHKFKVLAGDAARIVATASSLTAAAKALHVDRSTLFRWIKSGRVPPPGGRCSPGPRRSAPVRPQDPAAWARATREAFALTATEAALLDLAEAALVLTSDPTQKADTRLSAMGRFQALVKQLNFEQETDGKTETTSDTRRWPRGVV